MDNRSFKEKLLGMLPLLTILGGLASLIETIFKKDIEAQKTEKAVGKYLEKHPETLQNAIEAVQNNEEG